MGAKWGWCVWNTHTSSQQRPSFDALKARDGGWSVRLLKRKQKHRRFYLWVVYEKRERERERNKKKSKKRTREESEEGEEENEQKRRIGRRRRRNKKRRNKKQKGEEEGGSWAPLSSIGSCNRLGSGRERRALWRSL